jgi:hypothetical protein
MAMTDSTAEFVDGPCRQPVDGRRVGQVDGPHGRAGGVGPAPLDHLGQPVLAAGGDPHGGTGGGEGLGQPGADAGGASGDQHPGPGETVLERVSHSSP